MIPDPVTFLLLTLFGGWVAVDSTSAGQFMVSRPLVAATLAGWLAGDPIAGAAVGLVLEVFHLTVLPVGAARYPEGGPPAVAAGALFALSDGHVGALLTVVVFALVWERLSGGSVRILRYVNIRIVGRSSAEPEAVERTHFICLGVDLLRGVVIVSSGLLVLAATLGLTGDLLLQGEIVIMLVLNLAVVALLAGALRLFSGRTRFLAAGGVLGAVLHLLVG